MDLATDVRSLGVRIKPIRSEHKLPMSRSRLRKSRKIPPSRQISWELGETSQLSALEAEFTQLMTQLQQAGG